MSPQQFDPSEDEPIATDSAQSNVIAFAPRPRQVPVEPLFTDAERVLLRQMLREFQFIKQSCPVARRLTQEE